MGWRVHLNETPSGWARDVVELTIFRRLPQGGGEQLTGWDEIAGPITEPVLEGATLKRGFEIPRQALDSLRDQLKPGPSLAELDQLKEALATERARLDLVLDRLCPTVAMPEVSERILDHVLSESDHGADLLDRDSVRGLSRDLDRLSQRFFKAGDDAMGADVEVLARRARELAGPA